MKDLTADNWLARDRTTDTFERLGNDAPADPTELARNLLAVRLSDSVPPRVAAELEAARAALLYGVFFYPLYDVGLTHASRAAVASLRRKLEVASDTALTPQHLEALPLEQRSWWMSIDEMSRGHYASDRQLVADEIQDVLSRLVHSVNALFDESVDFLAAWRRSST